MIKVLEALKPQEAAGVLADTASWLAFAEPAPQLVPLAEAKLQSAVLAEARFRLGITAEDASPEAIERIADLLDEESDKLLEPPETEAALYRLAERGDLPSDLYQLEFLPNLANLYGKGFELENEIIAIAVKDPDMEQHYGPNKGDRQPSMISLFLRTFRTKWPFKDFVAIVVGQRSGFKLVVHQAWRVFTSKIDVAGLEAPIDWLRRFSEYFGKPVDVGGQTGSFFLFLDQAIPNDIKLEQSKHETYLSRFAQYDPVTGKEASALVVSINSSRYMAMYKEMRVRREEMLDFPFSKTSELSGEDHRLFAD